VKLTLRLEISHCEMLPRASKLAGFCEHCNEPLGSIRRGFFLVS
jgi:hypothetical protein